MVEQLLQRLFAVVQNYHLVHIHVLKLLKVYQNVIISLSHTHAILLINRAHHVQHLSLKNVNTGRRVMLEQYVSKQMSLVVRYVVNLYQGVTIVVKRSVMSLANVRQNVTKFARYQEKTVSINVANHVMVESHVLISLV